MNLVTGLPPAGNDNVKSFLMVADMFPTQPKLLPFHKEINDVGTALLFWETIIPHSGLPKIIISDREPNFTSEL